MTGIEDDLRARLREIAVDAEHPRGARTAEEAIRHAVRHRRRVLAGMSLGVLVVGIPTAAAVATSGGPSAHVTAPATASGGTTTQASAPSSEAGPPLPPDVFGPAAPQIGVDYPFSLLTHCGIDYVTFGGRVWRAVPPEPEPVRVPDANGMTEYTGYTSGVMRLLGPDSLRFTITDPHSAARGRSVRFAPEPATAPSAPLCG